MADRALATGPGRLLVAVYAIFVLAAGARSGVQIATKFDHARLAYTLSAVAALIYLLATIALALGARTLALTACGVDLVGVLAVGTLSIADSGDFPDATVWSDYGSGYGFVPLILPVLALLYLRSRARRSPGRPAAN